VAAEFGSLIVHTGNGKGKTTAAVGLAVRAAGRGLRVAFAQFVKDDTPTGERIALARFSDLIDLFALGEGPSWKTRDPARDAEVAREGWKTAAALVADDVHDMVILDELNIVLRKGYLPLTEVLDVLRNRPAGKHVVVTGRGAPDALIEIADLVTEMREVKHPYHSGVPARAGVEF